MSPNTQGLPPLHPDKEQSPLPRKRKIERIGVKLQSLSNFVFLTRKFQPFSNAGSHTCPISHLRTGAYFKSPPPRFFPFDFFLHFSLFHAFFRAFSPPSRRICAYPHTPQDAYERFFVLSTVGFCHLRFRANEKRQNYRPFPKTTEISTFATFRRKSTA